MNPVTITFFNDFAARAKREQTVELSDLARMIRDTTAGAKGLLPWLKLGSFGTARTEKGSLRHDANMTSISGIEADYDGELIAFEDAVEIAERAGLAALVYTSPSHSLTKPRWRILAPASHDLPPSERARLLARINGLYRGVFASESWTLSQSYYFGSVDNNPEHRAELIEGTAIDLLDSLDAISIGRPNGSTGPAPGSVSGPLDETALEQEILSGTAYHTACVRLVGKWAQSGVPFLDAQHRLEDLFDKVFPPDRDQRWRDRRTDIPRIIRDIYGKEAGQQDERVEFTIGGTRAGEAPEADTPPSDERLGYTQAEIRILDVPPSDRLLGSPFTTTTRGLLIGAIGVGKTNLMLAMATAMSEGKEFLHWAAGRPSRVLYVDGEMPLRLFKERSADAARRNGRESERLILLSSAALSIPIPPLNHPAGQRFIEGQIAAYGGFDFVFFDNIQSLLVGDMKEEASWQATLPWLRNMTNRSIGTLWGHHTGVDRSRGYGTSTREWQMDAVLLAQPAEIQGADLAFTLEFSKARERTPSTRPEFAPMLVTLTGEIWATAPAETNPRGRSAKDRALELLNDAIVRWGEVPPASTFIPTGTPCIDVALWRRRCDEAGISEGGDAAARIAFSRAAQQLVNEHRVGKHQTWRWVIK